MDSRALRSWEGVRDFAPTESQLRHKLPRYDNLNRGVKNSYYFGSKQVAANFNSNCTDTVDGGPVVSWIFIKTNQLITREETKGGSLLVQ